MPSVLFWTAKTCRYCWTYREVPEKIQQKNHSVAINPFLIAPWGNKIPLELLLFYMNNSILLTLIKPSILVGGQAVIDGVMMRVPGAYSTAVRDPDKLIKTERHEFISLTENSSFWKIPILRGMVSLFESMKIGIKTLQWSADISIPEKEAKEENKLLNWLTTTFAIVLSVVLFMVCPYWIITHLFEIEKKAMLFNLTAGLMRITFFLLYLMAISMLNDVKKLFQYHGAEHRVVYNFESGKDVTIKNAQLFPTQHPRCGTSFMFIVLLSAILVFALIDTIIMGIAGQINLWMRLMFHLPLLPLVTGIAYEIIKLTTRSNNALFQWLQKPGLWLQNITTKPPEDSMVEVAITALKSAFGDRYEEVSGSEYVAETIE